MLGAHLCLAGDVNTSRVQWCPWVNEVFTDMMNLSIVDFVLWAVQFCRVGYIWFCLVDIALVVQSVLVPGGFIMQIALKVFFS